MANEQTTKPAAVQKLREVADALDDDFPAAPCLEARMIREGADEIERLRAWLGHIAACYDGGAASDAERALSGEVLQ